MLLFYSVAPLYPTDSSDLKAKEEFDLAFLAFGAALDTIGVQP